MDGVWQCFWKLRQCGFPWLSSSTSIYKVRKLLVDFHLHGLVSTYTACLSIVYMYNSTLLLVLCSLLFSETVLRILPYCFINKAIVVYGQTTLFLLLKEFWVFVPCLFNLIWFGPHCSRTPYHYTKQKKSVQCARQYISQFNMALSFTRISQNAMLMSSSSLINTWQSVLRFSGTLFIWGWL